MFYASSENNTAAFSDDHSRLAATETKAAGGMAASTFQNRQPLLSSGDMNLTKSDVRCLRIKTRNSHGGPARSARKVDKKGRYMRDIMKQSECFEHFFSMTEAGSRCLPAEETVID